MTEPAPDAERSAWPQTGGLLAGLVAVAVLIAVLVINGVSAPREAPNAAAALGQAPVAPASAGMGARLTARLIGGAKAKLATYEIRWHAPAAPAVLVYVQGAGTSRKLFSGGGSDGSAAANFVQRRYAYVFTLSVAGLAHPIASIVVRRP